MTRCCALFLVCAVCLTGQTAPVAPAPASISAYYRLPGQTAGPYPYQWLLLDPPLTLTFDAAGSPHLTMPAPVAGPPGLPMPGFGLIMAAVPGAPAGPAGVGPNYTIAVDPLIVLLTNHQVRGEVPALVLPPAVPPAAPGPPTWVLAHAPIAATCFRNGLYQTGGSDYTLAFAVIAPNAASPWSATDAVVCDYSW